MQSPQPQSAHEPTYDLHMSMEAINNVHGAGDSASSAHDAYTMHGVKGKGKGKGRARGGQWREWYKLKYGSRSRSMPREDAILNTPWGKGQKIPRSMSMPRFGSHHILQGARLLDARSYESQGAGDMQQCFYGI